MFNRPGSPPQVRGKPLDSSFTASRDGITPAGAGKTLALYGIQQGEVGSPPQVRGKHDATIKDGGTSGITPAGAGKTTPAA